MNDMGGKKTTLILLLIVLLFFTSGCFHEISEEETSQHISWENRFEAVENFRKTTATELRKAVEDCTLRRNCWIEEECWLEIGITDKATGKYRLAPDMGDASITSEIAYEGEKSAKIVSYGVLQAIRNYLLLLPTIFESNPV